MATDPAPLADRLLEAQVAHVLAELSGPDAPALVAAEVGAVLRDVAAVPHGELVDREAAKATVRDVVGAVGGSPAIAAMVDQLVPLLYDLSANEQHDLGDVVMFGGVEAIVDVLVRSTQLRDEVLRRLAASPAVSALAMRFVQALLGDAVQQNRERAERLPGMKSAFAVGDLAARTARGMAPKQLETVVGGVADRGAQAAMERVSRALLDAFDVDAVREAVMEVWELHAEDGVAGLRGYLSRSEVEAVAGDAHALWLDLVGTPWFAAVLDASMEAFLDHYDDVPLGEVLARFGVDVPTVTGIVERHAGSWLAALHASGALETAVRRRLTPFWTSPATHALLAEATSAE